MSDDIRVVVLPDPYGPELPGDLNSGDVTFDDDRPILQWYDRYPNAKRGGWVLFTPDDDDQNLMGGGLNDVKWALADARKYLQRRAEEPEDD